MSERGAHCQLQLSLLRHCFEIGNVLKPIPSDVTSIPLKVSASSWDVTVGIKEAPRHRYFQTHAVMRMPITFALPWSPPAPRNPQEMLLCDSELLDVNHASRLRTRI